MHYVPVVIIGAGQAGLAMSHCLTQRRIEHVVLERGRIAERWRSERWDSLRLLTPNWMTRLPGWSYDGDDPDGYMTAPEFVRYLADYAGSSGAPIKAGTTVLSVRSTPFGYRVETNWFGWETRAVVIATGQCDVPRIPGIRAAPARMAASDDPIGVPQSRSTPGWRRVGGRRICNRRAACSGDPAIGPGCRPVGRASHTVAATLPWARHLVVARTDWRARRGDGRSLGPAARSRLALLPARGRPGRAHDRPRHIAGCGCAHPRSRHRRRGERSAPPRRPGRDHGRGTGSAGTPAGAHRHRR